jgi:outer membrane protein assembly factor BamA
MRTITKLAFIFYICLSYSVTHAGTGSAQRLFRSVEVSFADSQNGPVRTNAPKVEDSLSQHGGNKTDAAKIVTPVASEGDSPQYRSASEQQISYDDVYGLELTLPFAGSVELNATTKDEITVKLEKHGTGADEGVVQTYLNAVQLEISTKDDILLLTPRLPNPSDSDAQLTRLNCFIETPPDLTLKIKTESGDIRIRGIRGSMALTTNVGNVHLDKAMGAYQVSAQEGRIYGKILLTGDANTFETQSGSIDLVVLDEIAANMILKTDDGAISLRLPESYPADLEIQIGNEDSRAITIDLPVELETAYVGDIVQGWINGGGPLIKMSASQGITILPAQSVSTESETDDNEVEVDDLYADDDLPPPPTVNVPRASVQPIIDGNLFEKVWARSVPLSPFSMADAATLPNEPTQAFLLWDEQYLYIGARIYDSQMKGVQITQTNPDSSVWLDDTFEILVDPNPATPTYHHLVINPIGTVFDQHIEANYPLDSNFETAYKKIAKPDWDSRAQVKTQITPTFWSVEVALPRDALEPSSLKNWRFNLHRKIQGDSTESPSKPTEYSYWSPTYDEIQPWWPHWSDRMGTIRLAETENSESAQGFEFVEQFSLAAIEVEGNSDIPTSELLEKIPFQSGDTISVDELSWLNREFEALDWFSDVRIGTSPDSSGSSSTTGQTIPEEETEAGSEPSPVPIFKVNLRIHVTEVPTGVVEHLNIHRNRYFISPFLRAAFGLKQGRTSIEELNTKCELIENLYRRHGYDLVQITHQFSGPDSSGFSERNTHLLIDIDEGHLDDIRFSGNHRITRTELTDALGFKQGDAYSKQIGTKRLNQMRTKLNKNSLYFKRIKSWGVKREGDRNVLAIEVEERSRLKVNWMPIFDFNRVHGLILGGGAGISTREGDAQIYGQVSNGLSSKIWNYQVGAEKTWFDRPALTIGGSVYQQTDANRYARWSKGGEFLGAFFLGSVSLDYYQRKGYQAQVKGELTRSMNITLEFTDEDHEILFKSTDWSLLNNNIPKRGNLRIDEGHLRSITVGYNLNSLKAPAHQMQNDYRTKHGWRGNFSVEYADERLNSDFDFNLYRFTVVRYNQLFNNHHLNFRLIGGFSDGPLPRQRLLYLGGINALRGYDSKEFAGDNILLLNMEYRIYFGKIRYLDDSEGPLGVIAAFLDTGDAWFYDEAPRFDSFNTSVGVGLSLFLGDPARVLGFEVARALRKERNFVPILLLSQRF